MSAATARGRAFIDAISESDAILTAQRRLLASLGCEVQSGGAVRAADVAAFDSDAASEERVRLLLSVLNEVKARQAQIDEAIADRSHDDWDAIALDAFVHAMHRIRTCLDVALSCSEEVSEMSDHEDVILAGRQSANAIRLVYHYTHELNDLASLRSMLSTGGARDFCCAEALRRVIGGLERIAGEQGVRLSMPRNDAPIMAQAKPQVFERLLTYLVLTSIVTPGVKTVTCSLEVVQAGGMRQVACSIADDGLGISLEERADSGTYAGMLGGGRQALTDASGFGVARRMAHALGGAIELELTKGVGSKIILTIPAVRDG